MQPIIDSLNKFSYKTIKYKHNLSNKNIHSIFSLNLEFITKEGLIVKLSKLLCSHCLVVIHTHVINLRLSKYCDLHYKKIVYLGIRVMKKGYYLFDENITKDKHSLIGII